MTAEFAWPDIEDEALVTRLIPAIQQAIAGQIPCNTNGELPLPAGDTSNVLLMILATILETSPACNTPAGMRKVAEAAGKELLKLMRDTRRVRQAKISTGFIDR